VRPGDVTASPDPDTDVIATSRATEYTETVPHSDYYVHLSHPPVRGYSRLRSTSAEHGHQDFQR
jgi:hypothetical protein